MSYSSWSQRFLAISVAAFLGAGAVGVQAQPQPRGGESRDMRHDDRRNDRDQRNDRNNRNGRNDDRRGHDARDHRGAGPDHRWVRGSRVPQQYRGYSYVVNDWRGHRLSAPPRGYRWIQNGGDYLLIAVSTGLIAQIVFGN